MPAHALRPRTVTEILDAAIQLYRAHLASFVVLGAVLMVPFIILGAVVLLTLMPQMPQPGASAADFDITPFLWLYALMPFGLVWVSLTDGGIQLAASDAYLGGSVSAGRALRQSFGRGWRIVGATLLKFLAFFALLIAGSIVVGIAAAISTVAGIAAGVALFVLAPYSYGRLAFVPSTCVLEDAGATRAVERSISLSAGHGWRIVGALFVVYLVLVVLQVTVAIGIGLMGLPLVGQVLGQLVWIFGYPIVAVLTMLLYYDVRIRKEGFDLEVMSADLARLPDAPAAVRAPEDALAARRMR